MEIIGRDSAREAYRVAAHGVTGLIPDHVIASNIRLTGGRGHQTAYEWIARHATDIEDTLKALSGAPHAKRRIAGLVLEEDE
ncbi:MAG: hypothetical protein AAGK37_00200 [Pseudomonadota bacterium]